jgi:hypothetical protein
MGKRERCYETNLFNFNEPRCKWQKVNGVLQPIILDMYLPREIWKIIIAFVIDGKYHNDEALACYSLSVVNKLTHSVIGKSKYVSYNGTSLKVKFEYIDTNFYLHRNRLYFNWKWKHLRKLCNKKEFLYLFIYIYILEQFYLDERV